MINYHVYLGPYLECEYELVQTQRFKKVCRTEDCPTYNKPTSEANKNFCGICGQPLVDIPEIVEKPNVDDWQLVEDIDEALFSIPLEYITLDKPAHIWIPNVRRGAPRKFGIDPIRDYQVARIVADMIYNEMTWLLDNFTAEIAILQKHYKRCVATWGIIVYSY